MNDTGLAQANPWSHCHFPKAPFYPKAIPLQPESNPSRLPKATKLTPSRSWREQRRHQGSTPRTPQTVHWGSRQPMYDSPSRARHHSATHSRRLRSDWDDTAPSWSLGKQRRSLSPRGHASNAGDPTPSQLRLTKKRKGAKLRVAIQAFSTPCEVDGNEPGDLDDCHALTYDEYVAMVGVIANATKNAVEYVLRMA